MLDNRIDEIQKQYMYAIKPVQLFETKNSNHAQKSSFDFINQMNQNGFNPFHPNVKSNTMAKNLDLTA
ncbi:hypothetical protein J6G99_03965 [bacterium]|nr:hypothetical protein [bacterium]